MANHQKRFIRWRNLLPENTNYLIDQVLLHIVPEFEKRGFIWYPDYAGGDAEEISASNIPLQNREGTDWPTVQIDFKKDRPEFGFYFAVLPPTCQRWDGKTIPQEKGIVMYAPVWFSLCKGKHKNLDCQFGYHWFSLFPKRRLDAEIDEAISLLPVIFDLFDKGIPEEWLTHQCGMVSKHIDLRGSWHITEDRIRRKEAENTKDRT
jgi:hypothetical protein